ncbi:MAG TPA: GNAT family N-acetyltransferase [Caulobacteraceae bacterium]
MRMPPTPLFETARLWLCPCSPADVPAVQRRFPRWEVVEFLSAVVPWPYPADGAHQNMVETLNQLAAGSKSHWSLFLKEGGPGEMVGRISLWPDDGQSRDMRGFWLDPDFRGRGLMTEAADRVTDYALEELGWPRLWLSNAQPNLGSARVKQRQGAKLIATEPGKFVSGEFPRQVWLLTAEAWAGRAGRPPGS